MKVKNITTPNALHNTEKIYSTFYIILNVFIYLFILSVAVLVYTF